MMIRLRSVRRGRYGQGVPSLIERERTGVRDLARPCMVSGTDAKLSIKDLPQLVDVSRGDFGLWARPILSIGGECIAGGARSPGLASVGPPICVYPSLPWGSVEVAAAGRPCRPFGLALGGRGNQEDGQDAGAERTSPTSPTSSQARSARRTNSERSRTRWNREDASKVWGRRHRLFACSASATRRYGTAAGCLEACSARPNARPTMSARGPWTCR